MGEPCGKSTGQPGGSSTNYRDNGGSPNARNDPNNNPSPPNEPARDPRAVIQLVANGPVMAEVVHINNGYQGGRDPNSVNMDATVAGVITIREELARLQNRVEVQDLYIKELEASNAKHVEDKEQMTAEIAELKRVLADPKAEIDSLKSDVQSLKQWTKKLDWSTANIPDALTKHYEIKQVNGLKDTLPNADIPITFSSVQTVDGVYHGPYEYTLDTDGHMFRGYKVDGKTHGVMKITWKGYSPGEGMNISWMGKNLYRALKTNTDGGMEYLCADEDHKGVS